MSEVVENLQFMHSKAKFQRYLELGSEKVCKTKHFINTFGLPAVKC
jgi:hypothetical protein